MTDAPENRSSAASIRARLRAGRKKAPALAGVGVTKRARPRPPIAAANISSNKGAISTAELIEVAAPLREPLVPGHVILLPRHGSGWDDAGVWASALRAVSHIRSVTLPKRDVVCFVHVSTTTRGRSAGRDASTLHAVPVAASRLREVRSLFRREMVTLDDELTGGRKVVEAGDGRRPADCVPRGMSFFAVLAGELPALVCVADAGEVGPPWAGQVLCAALGKEPPVGKGRMLAVGEREKMAAELMRVYPALEAAVRGM